MSVTNWDAAGFEKDVREEHRWRRAMDDALRQVMEHFRHGHKVTKLTLNPQAELTNGDTAMMFELEWNE